VKKIRDIGHLTFKHNRFFLFNLILDILRMKIQKSMNIPIFMWIFLPI